MTIKNKPLKVKAIQKLLSIVFPVKIDSAKGTSAPELTLYYFQGRWQLGAATVLYSDGPVYKPLRSAFKYLKKERAKITNMLVLGAGLGSAVEVLARFNCYPSSTLVEIDPQIIAWASNLFHYQKNAAETKWICQDARDFIQKNKQCYDLVVLDIFEDRKVPDFVCTESFLSACKNAVHKEKGILVFNYIINDEKDWEALLAQIQSIFIIQHIISIGINRILILRNNA